VFVNSMQTTDDMKNKASSRQPLVSVVTPVYNGEKYLRECIESVLFQTYQNWEYVVVDNCSSDRTPEILKDYAAKDERILPYRNQTFVSAIENHHAAFRHISDQSAWCKVVHGDDFLFPECLERMVTLGEEHPVVGIVGAYRIDGTRVNLDGLPYPSHVTSGRQICRRSLLDGLYVFGSPSSLLVRSSILRDRDPFYNEKDFALQADIAACYEILGKWDFGFVHQVLTFTRRHEQTQSVATERRGSFYRSDLAILKEFGPHYLEKEEYRRLFDEKLDNYYGYLAGNFFRNRGKEFWEYQRDTLKRIHRPLNKGRFARALLLEGTDVLLNQKRLVAGLLRRAKRFRRT
jgi:glycosyltransferase involved in cell wall biosynthesis